MIGARAGAVGSAAHAGYLRCQCWHGLQPAQPRRPTAPLHRAGAICRRVFADRSYRQDTKRSTREQGTVKIGHQGADIPSLIRLVCGSFRLSTYRRTPGSRYSNSPHWRCRYCRVSACEYFHATGETRRDSDRGYSHARRSRWCRRTSCLNHRRHTRSHLLHPWL